MGSRFFIVWYPVHLPRAHYTGVVGQAGGGGSTPIYELYRYWLPVKERIISKILLVTYKIVHGFAPAYLNELLLNYTPHRLLRSCSLNLLSIPKTKTVTYGDRSFTVMAPKLWNDLPIIIKQC